MAETTISKDGAIARALRTVAQFVIGLFVVVWDVPGVPDAVSNYVSGHFFELALVIGVPVGVVTYVWGLLRKDVPNR